MVPTTTNTPSDLVLPAEAQRQERYYRLAQSVGLSGEFPIPENVHEAHLVEHVLEREMDRLSIDEHERLHLQLYGFETPTTMPLATMASGTVVDAAVTRGSTAAVGGTTTTTSSSRQDAHFPSSAPQPYDVDDSCGSSSSSSSSISTIGSIHTMHHPETLAPTNMPEESSGLATPTLLLMNGNEAVMVHRALQEFERVLQERLRLAHERRKKDRGDETDPRHRSAYELAYYWNPAYCRDVDFRLHFLRAERWSVKDAVDLFLFHFETKREVFVEEAPSSSSSQGRSTPPTTTGTTTANNSSRKNVSRTHNPLGDDGSSCGSTSGKNITSDNTRYAILGRDVRWSDLDAEDRETVRSGFCQVGQVPDAAGRTVLYLSHRLRMGRSLQNVQRALWYIVMSMLQEKKTTTVHALGIVVAISFYRCDNISIRDMFKLRRIRLALPIVIAGAHLCYSGNEALRPSVACMQLYQYCFPKRVILKVHQGEPRESMEALQLFGIPVNEDRSPWSHSRRDHVVSIDWHRQWLETLRSKEEKASVLDTLHEDMRPRRFDVLFGKGKESLRHPGTLRCNHIVEMLQQRYEAASRRAKTQIADQVWSIVTESNGRFLKRAKRQGVWQEVDKLTAREKISHFFRKRRSGAVVGGAAGHAEAPCLEEGQQEMAERSELADCSLRDANTSYKH